MCSKINVCDIIMKRLNETQKYKLRCLNKGILVTSEPEKYNIIWIRNFNPEIYSIDKCKDNQ